MRNHIVKTLSLISVLLIEFFLVITFVQIQFSLNQQKNKQISIKSQLTKQSYTNKVQYDQKVLDQIKRNSETGSLISIQPNDGIAVSDLSQEDQTSQSEPSVAQTNGKRIIIR